MNRPLSHRDISAFFVPLVLWSLLIMVTHAVVNAALAREPGPTVVLAAYSVALALYRTVNAWSLTMQQAGLAFISDRRSIVRLALLGLAVVSLNGALFLLLAFTPLGDAVYRGVFGAGPAVVAQARRASLWLAPIFPVELARNLLAALLMQRRRTPVIFLATVVRAAVLMGTLLALHRLLDGVVLGAVAVGLGFVAEAGMLAVAARGALRALPAAEGQPVPHAAVVRYSWPLAVNVITENGIVLVVNAFIGQLAGPDRALAAFGVVQAVSLVFLTPLRNLAQTAQALTHSRRELRTVLKYTLAVAAVFCALFVALFYTPLQAQLLRGVLGLEPGLAAYAAPATLLFVLTPPVWAFAAVLRGLLARLQRTGVLAASGILRLAGVAGVSATTLLLPTANGAVVGMLALSAGFALESGMLGHSLWRLLGLRGASGTASDLIADD